MKKTKVVAKTKTKKQTPAGGRNAGGRRPLPRPFKMPWGEGMVVEEVSIQCEYHEPCVQLLEFDEGYEEVRFCYYDLQGRFQRGPMIIEPSEMNRLAKEFKNAPRLKKLLANMLG